MAFTMGALRIKSTNEGHQGIVASAVVQQSVAATTDREPIKIEANVNGEAKRLFVPAKLYDELESALGRPLTKTEAKEILSSQSMLKTIERKLNSREESSTDAVAQPRQLTDAECRQILLLNGVQENSTRVKDKPNAFYLEAGDPSKDTVLLIHGGGKCSSINWKYQILDLSRNFHVVAVDLPGYGSTAKPDDHKVTLKYMQDFIVSFMDSLGITSANLVGNSMGGGVSAGVAYDYPQRVDKLFLIAPTNITDVKVPLAVKAAASVIPLPMVIKLANKLSDSDRIVNMVLRAFNKNKSDGNIDELPADYLAKNKKYIKEFMGKDGFAPAFWEYLEDQFADFKNVVNQVRRRRKINSGFKTVYDLDKFKMPVELEQGDDDPFFSIKKAKNAADHPENGKEFKQIAHSGHGPQYDRAEEVNSDITKFFAPESESRDEADKGRFRSMLSNVFRKVS